jgi:integrase
MGFNLKSCTQLGGRHITALCEKWDREKLAAATIASRLSVIRVFSGWISKPGLCRSAAFYLGSDRTRRSTINRVDKSWSAHGIDVMEKIAEVKRIDPRVGLMLDLQRCFSMRPGESIQYHPNLSYSTGAHVIAIRWGTKGGRERFETISTADQRRVLEEAKGFALGLNATVSDPSLSLKAARNHYWRVMAQCGITKKAGNITSYGLRHSRSSDLYREITGQDSPVRGGGQVAPDLDEHARRIIGSGLGHSRVNIVAAYIGKKS